MNLNLLKHFLAVYDFNSITKAAEQLNITQPSMSAAIKSFEEQTGKVLFHRNSRSIDPTDEAHYLAVQCRDILERMDIALSAKPKLKVCCPETVMHLLPNMEDVLFVETPAVEYSTLDKVRVGEVDILIDDIAVSEHAFIVESVGSQKIAFACRQDHPEICDTLSLAQFKQADHIMLRLKDKHVSALETRTEESFVRNIVREVSGQSNLLLNVRNSDAICIVSESMFALANELGLKILKPPFAIRHYEMKMIYHRRNLSNNHHKLVREQIKSTLASLG